MCNCGWISVSKADYLLRIGSMLDFADCGCLISLFLAICRVDKKGAPNLFFYKLSALIFCFLPGGLFGILLWSVIAYPLFLKRTNGRWRIVFRHRPFGWIVLFYCNFPYIRLLQTYCTIIFLSKIVGLWCRGKIFCIFGKNGSK